MSAYPGDKPPTRICLTCRTLYDASEECRGKKHKTVHLASKEGRTRLDDEVWGPDSRARTMRQAAKAGAGGGAAGALDWCGGGCTPFDACEGIGAGGEIGGAIVGVLVVIIGAIIGVVLFFLVRALVRFLQERFRRPMPHGALSAAPKLKKSVTSLSGIVKNGQVLQTPWKDQSAYAWAMELYENRVLGGGAMLRDARSAGFSLQLDDGRSLRVPAGRIRVVSGLPRAEDADKAKLEALVQGLDRARGSDRPVIPFEYAKAITIEEGDRVEVLGELTPDPDAQGGGYRANAGGFIPVGVPYLRVEKAAKVRVAPELPAPPPEIGGVAEAEAEPLEEDEEGKTRRETR